MKLVLVLAALSTAVMVVMIVQAVRQELNLRDLRSRVVENSAGVKMKEEAIIGEKNKIKELKTTLESLNGKIDELKKKKGEAEKSVEDQGNSLKACNTEKEDAMKKKTELTESVTKLKADHEEAKKKTEEDIKSLKQQILDRDKAICAFADTTKEEARKLCGISEAPK